MEPVVILKNIMSSELPETPTASHQCRPVQRKRRKNRRSLFSSTKTKHNFTAPKMFEPSATEYFSGFITSDFGEPTKFCGFSEADVRSSVTQKILHPLYGIDREEEVFNGCGKRVISCGDTYPSEHIMTVHPVHRRRVRALSLFDGVATGLLVLAYKLNLDVEVYYSSETCPNALMVQDNKFPGHIVQLGDVRGISGNLLDALGRIDILIGGPPCSQVSLVNATKRGLSDPTSESYLYKEFIRVRDYLSHKAAIHGHLFLWMMEMTAHIEKADWESMSRDIGQEPVKTNGT